MPIALLVPLALAMLACAFAPTRARALTIAALLLLLPASAVLAQAAPQVGDTHLLTQVYETEQQGSNESSGSSSGRNALQERVVAIREDGLELEYDLPAGVSARDRAPYWQLPLRVFMPRHGPPQLLNRPELAARIDRWLEAARMPRSACGSWYFTWNAFQVECDPDSALRMIEAYDLRVEDLREGGLYRDPAASAPAPLARRSAGPEGSIYITELAIDPELVRRARVDATLALAQITRTPLTRDEAVRRHAAEEVSGTIRVTLEASAAGSVWRRTRVTRIVTRKPDGVTDTDTSTETVERRRLPLDGREDQPAQPSEDGGS